MKKIFITILLIFAFVISLNAQLKVGTISLKDSSGVLVINSSIKTNTATQWLLKSMMDTTIAGNGLKWNNGLDIVVGYGLSIVNDTLIYSGDATVVDDSTIKYVDGKLRVNIQTGYGLMKDENGLKLNLSTNSGLEFDLGVLKVKTDENSLTFDSSGNIIINPNANLNSLRIGNKLLYSVDGKLGVEDSLNVKKLIIDGGNDEDAELCFRFNENASLIGYISVDDINYITFYRQHLSVLNHIVFNQWVRFADSVTMDYGIQLGGRLKSIQGSDIETDTTITLGNGNFFILTSSSGATCKGIDITNWQAGSQVTLYCSDGGIVFDNNETCYETVKPFLLKGGIDFEPSQYSVITLIYDGTYWREISRTEY